jgi:hypothetical protein
VTQLAADLDFRHHTSSRMARPTSRAPSNHLLDPDRPEIRKLSRLLEHRPLTLPTYHAIGEQLRRLSEDPAVAIRGSDWRTELAQILGQSKSTLNKCLQFRTSYEENELDEVEGLGAGWAYVTIALGIPNKKQRHQLLSRAREKGWNGRELQRAVQRLKGTRRGGGRSRRRPKGQGLRADLLELTRLAELWTDFHDRVWEEGQEEYVRELGALLEEARDDLRQDLKRADKQIGLLRKRCGEALRGLKDLAGRLERPDGRPGGNPG